MSDDERADDATAVSERLGERLRAIEEQPLPERAAGYTAIADELRGALEGADPANADPSSGD